MRRVRGIENEQSVGSSVESATSAFAQHIVVVRIVIVHNFTVVSIEL